MVKQNRNPKAWKEHLEDQFAYMKAESVSIACEMGIRPASIESWKDVPKIIQQFSRKNSSPSAFIRNLDKATYEIREKIRWTTNMASHLAIQKVKASEPLSQLKKRQRS